MRYTVTVEIDVETNDQPPDDVRRRLSNVKNRVGQRIREAARDAANEAIWVGFPDSYFPNWPKDGRGAQVVAVRQHTRRAR